MSERLSLLFENYPQLEGCHSDILAAAELLKHCYQEGGKLLLCGNGGSAADADHIAGELLKGFQSKRPLASEDRDRLGEALASQLEGALPAIPLTSFPALGSAYANDVDGDYTFAQLTWGLGQPGDVLWGLSTSGNSANVLHAARVAKAKGMKVFGMTGSKSNPLAEIADLCIQVPSEETFRIQEFHLPVYHTLCLLLEDAFFPG